MKLATYQFDDGIGPARVAGNQVADLRALAPTMIELIERGWSDAEAIPATIALDPIRLLAPVPSPRAFLGIGLNYRDHAAEVGRPLPAVPPVFAKLLSSVAPPYGRVARPAETFDYEGELGVVMGVGGAVAGYVVVNDLTIRSLSKPDTLVRVVDRLGRGSLQLTKFPIRMPCRSRHASTANAASHRPPRNCITGSMR
jgi:2-keto-4-pentenoate hydratase/2-oxohepta-3-ene-1,7-dioic acid hydratase in catechol pathway